VLILDEPTSVLIPTARLKYQILRTLPCGNEDCVLSSHNLDGYTHLQSVALIHGAKKLYGELEDLRQNWPLRFVIEINGGCGFRPG
jgi:ABC-type multidrug transport system ATPase subunit